jgi:hypothetical protein
VVLTDHRDSEDHSPKEFDYRQVIGKLLYLEKSTRPDISCAVHQYARHYANPKAQHTLAVKRIGRYLLATKDKGLIMKPNHEVQPDQGWDMSLHMQDALCIEHQRCRQK